MHWLELFEDLDQEHVIRASLSLTIVYMGISCFRFWTNRGQRDDQIVRLLSSIYVAMNKYLIWVWSMIDMIEVKIRSFLFVLISEILFFLIIFIYQISDQIWAFGDDYRNLHFFFPSKFTWSYHISCNILLLCILYLERFWNGVSNSVNCDLRISKFGTYFLIPVFFFHYLELLFSPGKETI